MPDDATVGASLAYRKNETAILRGDVPDKYTRLLPYIPGQKILEIGSAEGVLALLLARLGRRVTAIERSAERHETAVQLAEKWGVSGVIFANGDVADLLKDDPSVAHPFEGIETLVCVRVIYYFGEHLDRIFAEAARHIPNIVLCGNKNRALSWREGLPNRNDRADNYYASPEGMKDVLTRHGYAITSEVLEGDPIVVGRR